MTRENPDQGEREEVLQAQQWSGRTMTTGTRYLVSWS